MHATLFYGIAWSMLKGWRPVRVIRLERGEMFTEEFLDTIATKTADIIGKDDGAAAAEAHDH